MINAGERLLEDIGNSDLGIVGAFWLFFAEAGEWRLVLVSPRVDRDGPRKLYEELAHRIYKDSDRLYGLQLRNFAFFSPTDTPVMAIAGANLIHDLEGKRMGKAYFGGTYVGDIYVYFISDSIRAYVPASLNYERPRNPPIPLAIDS